MYEITKSWQFSASHQLPYMPEGHKCKRLHGHTYEVEIKLQFDLLHKGLTVDFGELDVVGEFLKAKFDHRHLNEVLKNPTSELLAQYIAGQISIMDPCRVWFPALFSVTVRESPSTSATFYVK